MAGFVKQRKRIPITMRRVGKELPKLIPVDVRFPLPGLRLDAPRDQIPIGAAFDTDGIQLQLGALKRARGRIQLGSTLDADIVLLTNYLTEEGITETLAATPTKLYKFLTDWIEIPKNPAGNMSGLSSDLFWATQIGTDLAFCQGADQVFKYSGGSDFSIINANCPSARTGASHQGRLLLGYTIEAAFDYPYRVRWNVLDDLEDWIGAGSGYIDLDDSEDIVTGIKVLNGYPVIFKESTIIVANRTGQISPAYEFFERDTLHGTISPEAIVDLGDALAYIGENDIFVFDLNKSTSIGDQVKSKFFDEINPEHRNQCIGYLVDSLDEVRFCTPSSAKTYNDYEWVWNRRDKTWCRRLREVKCAGMHPSITAPTWDSLDVTWDSYLVRWNSGSLQPSTKHVLLGTASGVIFEETSLSRSLGGSTFKAFYEFGDIQLDPSKFSGIDSVEVRHRDVGTTCALTLGLSVNGGSSWSDKTKALYVGLGSGEIVKTHFFHRKAGTNISFRLFNESATDHFEIVGIRLWLTTVGK